MYSFGESHHRLVKLPPTLFLSGSMCRYIMKKGIPVADNVWVLFEIQLCPYPNSRLLIMKSGVCVDLGLAVRVKWHPRLCAGTASIFSETSACHLFARVSCLFSNHDFHLRHPWATTRVTTSTDSGVRTTTSPGRVRHPLRVSDRTQTRLFLAETVSIQISRSPFQIRRSAR